MATTNMQRRRISPRIRRQLNLEVLGSRQVSPHFMRVTLGRGDIADFEPMGFDQWFRLFLPVGSDSLDVVPDQLTTAAYLRLLSVAKTRRPILRNYSVRAYRAAGDGSPAGAEIDVDFVLHPTSHDPGPAVTFACTCLPGDRVAIIDQGISFNPPPDTDTVALVADETGLPAVAGILESLPKNAVGTTVLEIPTAADRQTLNTPPGIDVTWVVRAESDPAATPGSSAGRTAAQLPFGPKTYGWVVGESRLATGMRRHWISQGAPKDHVTFCGYWKAPAH